MKLKNSILGGVLFILLIVFLTDPADYAEAVFAGLKIWASSLLPAMLPFMFISRLILDYGDLTFILRPAEKLLSSVFGVNKAFALPYVSGLLSGYPSAALLAGELCRKNIVPAFQLEKFLSFSLTVSPVFTLASLPLLCRLPNNIAFIVFLSDLAGCALCGALFNIFASERSPSSSPSLRISSDTYRQPESIGNILSACIQSCLMVGGFVAVFFMFIQMISRLGLPQFFIVILSGLIEMTSGCIAASGFFGMNILPVVITFFVSFGGVCVNLQCFAFVSQYGVKFPRLLFLKFLNALSATAVCSILLLLFNCLR
jgi:hypothetical protein